MAVLRPSEYSPNNMAASSLDERVAEGVRRFPVLYDKSCKDFKDANKKKNAWEEVAKQAGLSSGMLNCKSERSLNCLRDPSHLPGVNPFLFLFGLELGTCLPREISVKMKRDRKDKRKLGFMEDSAPDSDSLIFTRSYRSALLITTPTPTPTPSLVKTSLK